jgi:hypothetical protein
MHRSYPHTSMIRYPVASMDLEGDTEEVDADMRRG